MEITIKINGRFVSVEVSAEVADYLEQAKRNNRKLYRERQRYWDGRECDEYIIATEGRLPYCATPEELVWVRSMCTPASAAIPRTALPSGDPCGISVPAPHSSALSVCRFGYPSTVLLSFPDSLSGLFLALIGSLSFSLHLRHKTTFFPRRFFTFYHWR